MTAKNKIEPHGKKTRWIISISMLVILTISGVSIFFFGTRNTHVSTQTSEMISPYLNLRLEFTRVPDFETLRAQIEFTPDFEFTLSQNDNSFIITSTEPQPYQESITLEIKSFSDPITRTTLQRDFVSTFIVREPNIVAITADGSSIVRMDDGLNQEFLYIGSNITELAASYTGEWLAFVETDETDQSSITIIPLAISQYEPIPVCSAGYCDNPSPSPMSESFLYTIFFDKTNYTEIHTYHVDTMEDHLMWRVNGKLDAMPIWSQDGSQFAWYSNTDQATMIFNMESGQVRSFPKEEISLGTWSIPGDKIFVRHTHRNVTNTYSHLCTLDLFSGEYQPIDNPHLLDGQYSPPILIPGEKTLVFARQSVARENTKQLWQFDIDTQVVTQITDQPAYTHARYSFDQFGQYLLYQRLDLSRSDATPEIWYWDRKTGEFTQVAVGLALPLWLP